MWIPPPVVQRFHRRQRLRGRCEAGFGCLAERKACRFVFGVGLASKSERICAGLNHLEKQPLGLRNAGNPSATSRFNAFRTGVRLVSNRFAKASSKKPEAWVLARRETPICCAAPRLFSGSGKRRDVLGLPF